MLALMAGRNVKETSKVVQDGQVSDLPYPPQSPLTHVICPVVSLSLGPLSVGRFPVQCQLGKSYSDRRLPRIRAHCPVHPRAPPPLRVHSRSLHGQPIITAQPCPRRRGAREVRPAWPRRVQEGRLG